MIPLIFVSLVYSHLVGSLSQEVVLNLGTKDTAV